ncbi:MAG: alpha/beta fold hydrolase [Limisphaerales bacterium]
MKLSLYNHPVRAAALFLAVTLLGLPSAALSETNDVVRSGRQFVDLLAKGNFARAVTQFNPTMTKVVPEAKLGEIWQGLQAQTGAFKRTLGARAEKRMDYDIVLVTCEFARTNLDMKVVFDTNRQVAGLFFVPSRSAAPSETNDVVSSGRQFVDLLAKGNFARAVTQFDPTMTKAAPEAKLGDIWQGLQAQTGAFKRALGARAEKLMGYDIVLVTCEFARTNLDVKVVFNSNRQVAGLFFVPSRSAAPPPPPPYVRTNAFRERPVTVGSSEWPLPGTLAVPVGDGPWPAVVLVHGSGPEDRDETVGAIKPFRDLAEGLASRGIAVLRYEKRTKEHGLRMAAQARTITLQEETVDDAWSAVAKLRTTEGIDARRIFVLGHSLGGFAAPRIAKGDPGIAGLIIMAGSTRPLADIVIDQVRYLRSLDATQGSGATLDSLARMEAEAAKVKNLTAADITNANLLVGAAAAYWLDLRAYDAPATAKALKQRILVLQGERDYQVTQADFNGWKTTLGALPNVTFRLYPKLNHCFVAGTGKSTPSEYAQPGYVAEEVVADIAAWVLAK